jgi:hypothetical protein
MHIDRQVIDLATGIQRRRDFTAHVTGFAAGAVVLGSFNLADVRGTRCTPRPCSPGRLRCPSSTSGTSCEAQSRKMTSAPKPPGAAGDLPSD